MSSSRFAVADRLLSSPPSSLTDLKPRPAKVVPHAALTHRSANRLINHVQVLAHRRPPAVHYLEHVAARLRPASPLYLITSEDPTLMNPHQDDPDMAVRASVGRLMDYIQVFAPKRPRSVIAAEHFISELVADDTCHQIWDGIQRLSAANAAKVLALVAQLQQDQDGGTATK